MHNSGEIASRDRGRIFSRPSSRTSEHSERRSGTHTPQPFDFGWSELASFAVTSACGYGPRLKAGATAVGGEGGGRTGFPAIPTISCINIRRIPQALGPDRAMWYLASASFDRHT